MEKITTAVAIRIVLAGGVVVEHIFRYGKPRKYHVYCVGERFRSKRIAPSQFKEIVEADWLELAFTDAVDSLNMDRRYFKLNSKLSCSVSAMESEAPANES